MLSGDDIRALLQTFGEADERQERLETADEERDETGECGGRRDGRRGRSWEDSAKEITGGTTIEKTQAFQAPLRSA